jgi:hypothetical protein
VDRRLVVAGELLRDKIVLAGASLVLIALAVTGWVLWGGTGSHGNYTHIHCSACAEEFPYRATLAGNKCPVCGNGVYVPTTGSIKDGAAEGGAKTAVFLVLVLVLVQALAYVAAVRLRALRQAATAALNQLLICRCPYCGRKIGFPASKNGVGGICPRCKTAFTFVEQA